MASRASELFQRIIEGKADYLHGMVGDHVTETHYLEFKGGKIQKDDKAVKGAWSEGLSGFANTEGGVLVWGVRASKIQNPDDPSSKIDAAHEIETITNPSSFRQTLTDLHRNATNPPVAVVEIEAIEDPTAPGSGFVVCYVPEGNDKSYRAELHKSRNYMQRVGDNFVILQHPLLRTMFYPQLRSSLFVEITPEIESDGRINLVGQIGNSGTATARELWVVIRSDPHLQARKMFSFDLRLDAVSGAVAWEAFQSIHPGAKIKTFYYELKPETQFNKIPSATFDIMLHSQHEPTQRAVMLVSTDDIMNQQCVTEQAVQVEASSVNDFYDGLT